jgi:hypothetical protein
MKSGHLFALDTCITPAIHMKISQPSRIPRKSTENQAYGQSNLPESKPRQKTQRSSQKVKLIPFHKPITLASAVEALPDFLRVAKSAFQKYPISIAHRHRHRASNGTSACSIDVASSFESHQKNQRSWIDLSSCCYSPAALSHSVLAPWSKSAKSKAMPENPE